MHLWHEKDCVKDILFYSHVIEIDLDKNDQKFMDQEFFISREFLWHRYFYMYTALLGVTIFVNH